MVSFGENLRRERELRGVSLREIADATKISVRFLDALEHDRLDVLPGGIFRRAFVREYARHLGLDADRLVADFVFAHGAEGTVEPPPRSRQSAPNRGTLVAAGLVLVLIPLLAGKVLRERTTPAAPAAQTPAAPVARVYATPAPAAQEPPALERGDGLALTLSAKEKCWVAVRADGETVINRVLNRGETERVQAQGEIVLSVGNAGGIAFSVDDKPGVSLGRAGEVRRNIVITRESLPSLVEDAPAGTPSQRL